MLDVSQSAFATLLVTRDASPSSAGRESAVDHQTVPRHKRRLAGTQPQNSFRNFLDPTEASDGMKSGKIILFHIHAISEAIDHLCIDHRGIDRVDANPLRGIFQRSGFR